VNNWNKGVLGDFITLQRGFDLPEYERHTGNVPVVTSSGISDFHNEAKVKAPGVVMGRYGTIGAIYFVEEDYWPHNTTLWIKDFKGNYQRFIYYFLKTLDYQAHNDKSSVPGVNRNHLHLIPVNIPPLPEQRAIAGILGALDDKIELNRRMKGTLESMARAVFRQWFVDSEDVENWEVGRLGDFIGVNERSINKDYSNNEIEYIDISSVSVGHLEGTTSYALKDAPSRARRLVQHGDTIWSTVRPNRKSYLFIDKPNENLVVSTGFAVLTPKTIPPSFLYFFTTTEQFIDYLVSNADGSAYPAVLPERFADAEFSIPPKEVLAKFETIASPMLDQIAHNEKESRTLASLRDSLLPKLMRGEVRVKDVERML
jgi:type I restriction enzyme S subunit